MKFTEESLFSLEQCNLSPLLKSAYASKFASEPAEIPSELLIAASFGLRLFPAIRFAKHVPIKASFETATGDLGQIESWIRHYRGYPLNWHLATGPEQVAGDGVVALEVVGDQGKTALCELCQDDWDWLDILRSQAGNDTRYIFFSWTRSMVMWRPAKQLVPGLILHGEGDSVPVPPSQDRSGFAHAYLTPRAALAPPPEWLINVAFKVEMAFASARVDSASKWDTNSAA